MAIPTLFRTAIPIAALAIIDRSPACGLDVAKFFYGRNSLTGDETGPVYVALRNFELKGLMRSRLESGPPQKRIYEITEDGKIELLRHQKDWEQLARLFKKIGLAARKSSKSD